VNCAAEKRNWILIFKPSRNARPGKPTMFIFIAQGILFLSELRSSQICQYYYNHDLVRGVFVNRASTTGEHGLGIERPETLKREDDEFEAYRKRMMLAYRFRPNPLVRTHGP
jgi:hypothetical protein